MWKPYSTAPKDGSIMGRYGIRTFWVNKSNLGRRFLQDSRVELCAAMKKTIQWHIFKKSDGFVWPGEFWEDIKRGSQARKDFKNYDQKLFRLVKVTYEQA